MCLPTLLKMFDHVSCSGAALHCHDCHSLHLPCASASSRQSHLRQVARMASSSFPSSLGWFRSRILNIFLLFTALSLSAARTNLSCNSMDGASRHIKTLIQTKKTFKRIQYSTVTLPLPEKEDLKILTQERRTSLHHPIQDQWRIEVPMWIFFWKEIWMCFLFAIKHRSRKLPSSLRYDAPYCIEILRLLFHSAYHPAVSPQSL